MRWIKPVIAIALFIAVERFCHKQTGPFSLYKITYRSPDDPIWEVPGQTEDHHGNAAKLLDQSFTFLGDGAQCVAFLGEDKQTVLKFFKLHLTRPWFVRIALRSKEEGLTFIQKMKKARQLQVNKTFESLIFAFEKFQKDTGLIYLHLSPTTHFNKKVVIYDKIGVQQKIDLDQTLFFLQQKADPICPTLNHYMKNGEEEAARACIRSILSHIERRCALGFADDDPRINTNFGFVGMQAIEIDIGSFNKNPPEASKEKLKLELDRFKLWLEKEHPTLANEIH